MEGRDRCEVLVPGATAPCGASPTVGYAGLPGDERMWVVCEQHLDPTLYPPAFRLRRFTHR